MSVQRGTSSEIWHMDKLRHCDPKTARKMTRNGNGARHKQLAALAALEDGMAMVQPTEKRVSVHALPRTFLAHVSEEAFARAERLKRAGMRNTDLFEYLLDAAERPAPAPAAILTNEAANIVKTVQERLRLPTQLDAVKRMSEAITNAEARARKIVELEGQLIEVKDGAKRARLEQSRLEGQLRETREARDTAMRHAQAGQGAVAQAPTVVSKARPEIEEVQGDVQGLLFDFVAAFTGATAKADASGELIVDIPATNLSHMFPIWQKAVKVLGIMKQRTT